ncbi:hypothetical protein [Reyranella massiliensis]|uniref:hypothetical protein n=1 Tax=Reyranella massiliensis TaxID=445220 RepID=UPI0002FBF3DB|nr:hypothetical protein [Reyranella massiliensis]
MAAVAPRIHEAPDDLLAAIDFCYEQGWTDGLPVVPPQVDRVKAMLAADARPADTVICHHPATTLDLSLHAAAVNAVMAGCLPEYFPVLVAAFEAMNRTEFNFHGSTASTGGSAPLLVVSGPIVDEIGMNADVNLFGPGNRANSTIGRATRLILRNVFQMLPGISDKSTQGNPGKYSFCIAERSRGNPWPLLCEAQGYPKGTSSVTTFAGGGFCNVENHGGNTPEQILGSVADAMANYGCITLGQSVVILAPEHMRILADAGWTREQAQDCLFSQAKRSVEGMKSVGKYRDREYDRQHDESAHKLVEQGFVHRGLGPADILITMGGGDAGGHSCFIPSWSRGRSSLMQHAPIAPLPNKS